MRSAPAPEWRVSGGAAARQHGGSARARSSGARHNQAHRSSRRHGAVPASAPGGHDQRWTVAATDNTGTPCHNAAGLPGIQAALPPSPPVASGGLRPHVCSCCSPLLVHSGMRLLERPSAAQGEKQS